jgi:tetratricopeptide (TPR) repeat protein
MDEGDTSEARNYIVQAIEIRKRLADIDPTHNSAHEQLSFAHYMLGRVEELEGNFESAATKYRTAINAIRKLSNQNLRTSNRTLHFYANV